MEAGDDRLNLSLKAGEAGLSRTLREPAIRTSQRTLKDTIDASSSEVILILLTEDLPRWEPLPDAGRNAVIAGIRAVDVAAIIVPGTEILPRSLTELADAAGVPLFTSDSDAFLVESRVMGLIRERLHGVVTLQGVMVEVSGLGILITGVSGTGKSECALELLSRGHRLVADDVAEIEKKGGKLYGRSPEEIKSLMEIRGLGIIHVGEIFGTHAVADEAAVDLVVELMPAANGAGLRFGGAVPRFRTVLGVDLPLYRLPTRERSNMATVVEVLAKDHALRAKEQGRGE